MENRFSKFQANYTEGDFMAKKYILALDQGTTSSRSIIFDEKARVVALAQQEYRQILPFAGRSGA